jgi:hypothetical protein
MSATPPVASPAASPTASGVIVAVDGSEASLAALRWALVHMSTETVHLVHCYHPLKTAVGPHYGVVAEERGCLIIVWHDVA